jgi:pimeloyl-ACP methyl ester carboxylesterase
LIFVHGLGGSVATWQSDDTSWPILVAGDADLTPFDVFRLDYMTHSTGAPKRPTAQQIVESMLRVLDPTLAKYQAVYMICHSLGGNLMRHYLAQRDMQRDNRSAVPRRTGLFLLGTLVEGSDLARYKTIANIYAGGTLPALEVLQVIETNPYLEFVNAIWKSKLQRELKLGGPTTRVWAGYETVKTGGTFIVVTKTSATALVRDSARSPESSSERQIKRFAKDHFSLVKPANRGDEVYRWVKEELLASERSR